MAVAISLCLADAIVKTHRLEWWKGSECYIGDCGTVQIAIVYKKRYAILQYI